MKKRKIEHTRDELFSLPKNTTQISRLLSILFTIGLSANVFATEGGIGRPITGMQVLPLNGILPTETGPIVSFSSIYYSGSMNRSKEVPIAGRLVGGVDYNISYNLVSGLYVWKTNSRWSFASSASLPMQYTDIKVSLNGPVNSYTRQSSSNQFADIMFSPVIADYHVSPVSHILFGVNIFAPTGSYDKNRLDNAGQNTWTFAPNIAYTTIFPKNNIELTGVTALEFYTRNKDTDYQNGTLLRFDGLALKRFGSTGWGAGLNVGWIQQIESDEGKLADRLDGNKGRAFGAGPIVSYEKKTGNTQISTSLRWIHEFDVKNRPEGDGFQLNLTAQF